MMGDLLTALLLHDLIIAALIGLAALINKVYW